MQTESDQGLDLGSHHSTDEGAELLLMTEQLPRGVKRTVKGADQEMVTHKVCQPRYGGPTAPTQSILILFLLRMSVTQPFSFGVVCPAK